MPKYRTWTDEQLIEAVKNSKYVDQVIPNAPLITTDEFMDSNNLDFVLISPEYDCPTDHYYAEPRKSSRVIVGSRYPHMSTSEIIRRIKARADL